MRRAAAIAACLCAAFVRLQADPVRLPHTTIYAQVLQNGLRAYLVEDHDAPVANVHVWYHVGSKNEPPGRTGFAHLFEHLMFDGTRNLGPGEFSDYIVRAGGLDNAYTTEDATVFWETIPSNQLPVALWLEADRMRNLEITDQVFKTEREVVKEERRQRFDNQPYGTVVETLYEHAFTVHPYRHSTIGTMEDLDRASINDIKDFYDTYYVPNNATLVLVGDFKVAEAEAKIQEYFGPLARGAKPIDRALPQEPPQTAERIVTLFQNVALPAFVEGYHMPADGTPDAYPLRLVSKILSQGESSLIYRRLVYEKQIAVEAESSGNFSEDPNLFFIFAVMNSAFTPHEGEREVESVLDRLKNNLVAPAELEKAKNEILSDYILGRQTDETRGEELGYAAVILKDSELVNTEPARFLAVTPEDIQRVVREYFVPQNRTLVEVYPQSNSGARAAK